MRVVRSLVKSQLNAPRINSYKMRKKTKLSTNNVKNFPVTYLVLQAFSLWQDSESIPSSGGRVARCTEAEDCKGLSDQNQRPKASHATAIWKQLD